MLKNIKKALQALGLEDLKVLCLVRPAYGQDDHRVAGNKDGMMLSEVCATNREIRKDFEDSFLIEVIGLREGERIGQVNCDGVFSYTAAVDLTTYVYWAMATDLGSRQKISAEGIQDGCRKLYSLLTAEGRWDRDFFFGAWAEACERVYAYERCSRFGDGYCAHMRNMWRVATRALGNEHEGYGYMF